jgi:uncharacterized protein (TIGR02246 family)
VKQREKAQRPEDLTRLFVECVKAGDADGLAALYEDDAVMAFPPGQQTVGRDAIRALWEKLLANRTEADAIQPEEPLPTLISGDLALTSTVPKDDVGARAQVARRQADGSWLRVLDLPEFKPAQGK